MSDQFADVETFGEVDETTGRPSNIPEKFFKPAEGESEASVDWGGLLKEYNYRTKQIGAADGMFGAPEDSYAMPDEINLPEGIEYEIGDDDPLINWFQEFAKESNLSQKAYNGIVRGYIEQNAGLKAQQMEAMKAEINALGPDGKGQEMIAQLSTKVENWTKDMPEDQRNELRQGYKDAVTSAAAFKFIQFLEKQGQPGRLPAGNEVGEGQANSLEALRKRQTEEVFPEGHPRAGQRRYDHDAEFRKQIAAERARILGQS